MNQKNIDVEEIKRNFPLAYQAIADHVQGAEFDRGYDAGKTTVQIQAKLASKTYTPAAPAASNIPSPKKVSMLEAFETLLKAHQTCGLSEGQSYEKIAKEHPILHAEFLQAINQRPDAKPEKKPLSSFEGLVSAFMETNKCSRGDAIEAGAHSHPEAHKAYIEAVQP